MQPESYRLTNVWLYGPAKGQSIGYCPRTLPVSTNPLQTAAGLIPPIFGCNAKHRSYWVCADGLRFRIGVRIVIESPFRKPIPEEPQVFSHEVKIISGKLGGLLFKIGKELWVLIQSPANVAMI